MKYTVMFWKNKIMADLLCTYIWNIKRPVYTFRIPCVYSLYTLRITKTPYPACPVCLPNVCMCFYFYDLPL